LLRRALDATGVAALQEAVAMEKEQGRTAREERAARLAAAMRENLKKRKAQERARQERVMADLAAEAEEKGSGSGQPG